MYFLKKDFHWVFFFFLTSRGRIILLNGFRYYKHEARVMKCLFLQNIHEIYNGKMLYTRQSQVVVFKT